MAMASPVEQATAPMDTDSASMYTESVTPMDIETKYTLGHNTQPWLHGPRQAPPSDSMEHPLSMLRLLRTNLVRFLVFLCHRLARDNDQVRLDVVQAMPDRRLTAIPAEVVGSARWNLAAGAGTGTGTWAFQSQPLQERAYYGEPPNVQPPDVDDLTFWSQRVTAFLRIKAFSETVYEAGTFFLSVHAVHLPPWLLGLADEHRPTPDPAKHLLLFFGVALGPNVGYGAFMSCSQSKSWTNFDGPLKCKSDVELCSSFRGVYGASLIDMVDTLREFNRRVPGLHDFVFVTLNSHKFPYDQRPFMNANLLWWALYQGLMQDRVVWLQVIMPTAYGAGHVSAGHPHSLSIILRSFRTPDLSTSMVVLNTGWTDEGMERPLESMLGPAMSSLVKKRFALRHTQDRGCINGIQQGGTCSPASLTLSLLWVKYSYLLRDQEGPSVLGHHCQSLSADRLDPATATSSWMPFVRTLVEVMQSYGIVDSVGYTRMHEITSADRIRKALDNQNKLQVAKDAFRLYRGLANLWIPPGSTLEAYRRVLNESDENQVTGMSPKQYWEHWLLRLLNHPYRRSPVYVRGLSGDQYQGSGRVYFASTDLDQQTQPTGCDQLHVHTRFLYYPGLTDVLLKEEFGENDYTQWSVVGAKAPNSKQPRSLLQAKFYYRTYRSNPRWSYS